MASNGPLPSWLLVGAAVCGLPFTWGVAYWFYSENKQQKNWLHVEGRVIRSGLTEMHHDVTASYKLDVRYAYWVNGRRYESGSVGTLEQHYSSRTKAQAQAGKYAVGSAVIALVNPDHPEEAFLEWGHSWWAIALAFFLGLGWAGAWLAEWYSTYLSPYLRRHEWIR